LDFCYFAERVSGMTRMDITQFPTEVKQALAWPFDFDVQRVSHGPLRFTVSPTIELLPLGGERSGGIYAQLRDRGDILFVDSEGSGGVIAPDPESLIVLLVCHPYWQELLKFSGGGILAEMRRALPFAERDYYQHTPEARELGAMIRERLSLPPVTDVVDILHSSVASSVERLTLTAPDGSQLNSLFNRFTVDRNPAWRHA
jgi:hypothetical protein